MDDGKSKTEYIHDAAQPRAAITESCASASALLANTNTQALHSEALEATVVTSAQDIEDAYSRHVNMLYRVCYSYMKNAADTEDIVSDVFLKLIQRSVGFESPEHEKAWLLRVAINLCKDNLKHWWRNRVSIDDYYDLESADQFNDDATLRVIMGLPERYKAVIYLHYYEGYSSPEIAKILKKPQSTILYHLHIARKLLKEVLENEE